MQIHNKDVFFSIIVPVYNVQDYLKQCLESILCQEYHDYEIILINDGSTDSSLEICCFYLETSDKIVLINKENGGLSDARNHGLQKASGDYIIFTDSDDYWVGSRILKDLNEMIKVSDPDIIIHEESRFFSDKDVKCKFNQRFLKQKSGEFKYEILQLIYYDLFVASACDKIIKKSILLNNDLYFPLGKKSEDIEWCGKLINYIDTFSIYPKSFYIYRQGRNGSITASVNENHIMDVYNMVKEGLNVKRLESNILNDAIQNYWACNYIVILKDFNVLSSKNRNLIWEDLVSWKYLLKKGQNLKIDKVMFFYNFLPFCLLPFFLNFYRIKTILYKKYRTLK
ncbi:glycosyltransferase family A protein [Flavobacterium sp. 5]|uniref:glycosyltransferase family 2 protein n=1 Tax=Flavobacterium sp. 5 TaxID=2035199 RepID=UPI000C2BFC75|nr:glycosyltransferase family A protein [Flavobacterium sp. 5]PKB16751.1 glycosyl transferase family 2 [Flavobacterium sp. 5]